MIQDRNASSNFSRARNRNLATCKGPIFRTFAVNKLRLDGFGTDFPRARAVATYSAESHSGLTRCGTILHQECFGILFSAQQGSLEQVVPVFNMSGREHVDNLIVVTRELQFRLPLRSLSQ